MTNTKETTLNGPELFEAGERILREAASETAPEWMLARSQLAAAHFAAAQAAAALNENLAQALLSLDAAIAWQRSQDRSSTRPPRASGGAETPDGDGPDGDGPQCDCDTGAGQFGEANLGRVDRLGCGLPPLENLRG